ncbi:MAG: phage/plasmid primase, P4 family [Actinoplanes sp.]
MTMGELFEAAAAKALTTEPIDRYTDAILGGRFAREYLTGRFYYTVALGWLRWDGQRWAPAADEIVHEHARRWVLEEYAKAAQDFAVRARSGMVEDKKASEDPAIKGWASAQGAQRLASITKLARGNDLIFRNAGDFDANPYLLNTPSGVVDMRTDEIKPHDPSGLHTKITAAAYRPEMANSPIIAKALQAYPADAHDWLQVRLGEACTGIGGKELVLLDGTGNNGKTALTGAVREALGGYGAVLSNTLLLHGSTKGAATPEKMDLHGLRFGYMEETPEGSYLEANVVKELLDASTIKGRQLYRGFVEWKPSHSLFLNTNNVPNVAETDDGSWRRLKRLHCPWRFRDVEGGEALELPNDRPADVGLKVALTDTTAGRESALAWAVAGAVKFLAAESLKQAAAEPESVQNATRAWRKSTDDLLRFVDAHMEFDQNAWVAEADLYESFRTWLIESGQKGVSKKTMVARIESHTLLRARVRGVQKRLSNPGLSRPEQLLRNGMARPLPEKLRAFGGIKFAETSFELEE